MSTDCVVSCKPNTPNRIVFCDKDGKFKSQITSRDLGGILNDVCGMQLLKSGNLLVSCYGNQSKNGLKMIEITPEKKVVWSYQNASIRYVHNVHVLTTNGKSE